MQKLRILVHAADAPAVLQALQKAGAVEFSEVSAEGLTRTEPTEFEFNYVSARLDFAVEFLSQYAPEKGGIAAALEGTAEKVDEARIADVTNSFYATDIIDAAQDIQKELNDTHKKSKELAKERAALLPWRKVPLRVGYDYDTPHTHTDFVQVQGVVGAPKGHKPHYALAQALDAAGVLYHILSVDALRAIVTYHVDGRDAARAVLKDANYTIVQFAARRGMPAEEIERIDRALVKTAKRVQALEERARELASNLPELKVLSDHTLWQKERHDVYTRSLRTRSTLVYEGWCPTARVAQVRAAVEDASALVAVEEIAPAEGEEPPVEIANSGIVQPFEMVTRLYGLPSPVDLDPTPYLAGFFFIFFGFCLTDFGYGVVLMLLTGFALWRYDVQKSMATMLKLLFLGGLASALAGLLFGGYFGVDMSALPAFLQRLQQFDPIKDPLPVFYLALALGVAQVLFGLVVAIIAKAQRGQLREGLLDHAPWIAFFVALGLFTADVMGLIVAPYARMVLYGAVAALVLTQGRAEKNIFMKLFKGVTSLYDIVAYFSDILSYSRLLALGLATSALAFAVNMIAGMIAGEDPSIFSMLAAGIVLVIGHVFNLVVNTLGAFIHSARLQFVEFFGKFLTGTGRVFAPFRRTERYTTLVE